MRKKNFFMMLVLAVFFMPIRVLAVETDTKDQTNVTAATSETPSKNAQAEEPSTKVAPIATVSNTEKRESTAPEKTEAPSARSSSEAVSKAPAEIPSKTEKTPETPAKRETSPALNTAEMQQRWKALISKEITPDSILYTVKPGDTLYVLAKKNHTTVDFIKKLNDLKSDSLYPKMKLKIHTAPFSIRIDKSKNTLVLYSDKDPVKKYSVATGKKNCTPAGEFKITDKLVHPTWFKTGAILPPGSPENALGTRWMGFDKPGYGIHGTIEPKSIGTQASEGCIRMLNEDVEELYSMVPVGTQVTIQD